MKTFLLIAIAILSFCIAKGQLLTRLTNAELTSQKQASFGCGWIDFNGDKLPDPYFTHIGAFAFFYENLGESNFKYISNTPPASNQSYLSGVSWGDYNNDGLNDLFICKMGGINLLMKNKGNGAFENISNNQSVKDNDTYLQSSFVDYDNDGWLDIFAPTVTSLNFVKSAGKINMLYRNDGSGNFTKATASGLMNDNTNTTCASFSDYDNDGDQDVFLTEFFRDNWFYENNGNGTFIKNTTSPIIKNSEMSLSCSWADYDNDGNMDLFVCNGGVSAVKVSNYLFHNNGDRTFSKVTTGPLAEYKGCSWSSAWGDLDNDGDLDLYLGTIYEDDIIFLNNGDGTFESYTNFERNVYSTGVAMGDYDNDGFLDVMIAQADNVSHVIFHNNGNANHWINVSLKGVVSNASAIGARVKIKAAINGESHWQYRELNGNQGLRGFNDLRVHFGLREAQLIDSLVVEWPSKGKTVLTNVSADQLLTITESMPEKYMNPLFSADTLTGRAALTVQFTDNSRFDPNNPIKTWSWDFDGDGIEDSNLQNPLYTFTNAEGQQYTVSLTVSNGFDSKKITCSNLIQLFPLYAENVARWNKATASSSESDGYIPGNAIDGDMNTRWASEFNDNQWFQIELDSTYILGKIIIKWENAYGREYDIQTSTDNVSWKTIFNESKGNGATDEIKFNPATAKFVRINLLKRATSYGFSFYEFEIYRSDGTIYTSFNESRIDDDVINIHPNPVNNRVYIDLSLHKPTDVTIQVFDLSGKKISLIANGSYQEGKQSFLWNTCNENNERVPDGIYICRIETAATPNELIVYSKSMIVKN
jgi:hypothetical protein